MSTSVTGEDSAQPPSPHHQLASTQQQPPAQPSNSGTHQSPATGPQGQNTTLGPTAGKARLQCHACNRLLEYDAGAQYVQCFSCSTMNAVQPSTQIGGRVLSMLCAICHTTNLAPYGINYVRCGSCSTISQVSHAYRTDRMMPSQQPNSQQQSADHIPRLAQDSAQDQSSTMQQLNTQRQQSDRQVSDNHRDFTSDGSLTNDPSAYVEHMASGSEL